MLTLATRSVPVRVESVFDRDESHLATLHGLLDSGIALTDRRLVAWRSNGVSGPLPLAAIDRILVDTRAGSSHVDVLVLPRQAVHAPLVLTLRVNELDRAMDFVECVIHAAGADPTRERWGPVFRASFATTG
jgi:hypothetical protein